MNEMPTFASNENNREEKQPESFVLLMEKLKEISDNESLDPKVVDAAKEVIKILESMDNKDLNDEENRKLDENVEILTKNDPKLGDIIEEATRDAVVKLSKNIIDVMNEKE